MDFPSNRWGNIKNRFYHFRFRSFENGIVKRMDVKVKNGMQTMKCLQLPTIQLSEPLKVKVKDNGIVIEIIFKYVQMVTNI